MDLPGFSEQGQRGPMGTLDRGQHSQVLRESPRSNCSEWDMTEQKGRKGARSGSLERQMQSKSPWERAKSGFRVVDSNTLGGWWLTLKNVFGFFHGNATGSKIHCCIAM